MTAKVLNRIGCDCELSECFYGSSGVRCAAHMEKRCSCFDARRTATCTCRECGIVFKMQLRYVWACRENWGPYCPAGCNGNDEVGADGSSTVAVDA